MKNPGVKCGVRFHGTEVDCVAAMRRFQRVGAKESELFFELQNCHEIQEVYLTLEFRLMNTN